MERRREENQKAPQPGAERKARRFRIIKLEERIAPTWGGNGTQNVCGPTHQAPCRSHNPVRCY
jgi:hypothetical protein